MATCPVCGQIGVKWVKRGDRQVLSKHFCIPSKTTAPVMGKVKKDPLSILAGVVLTNKALEDGLLEELGL